MLYQGPRRGQEGGLEGEHDGWQQTPWGRLIVGLLLAQGLNYVLQQLCTAGFLAARDEVAGGVWTTLMGLVVVQGLEAASMCAAGLVTGAGQRRGILFGAVVGVWNAVFSTLVHLHVGQPLTTINLFGEPVLQVAFGALGGSLGSLIWRPASLLIMPVRSASPLPVVPIQKGPSSFRGPVAWARVLIGITVAVGGVFWVDVIRNSVIEASEGKLNIDTQLQADVVITEISALAMIAGGVLAGATTRNGSKQGLCAGIGTGTVLFGLRLSNSTTTTEMLLLTLFGALSLGLVGGLFGSRLLPPVDGRRKRISAAPL